MKRYLLNIIPAFIANVIAIFLIYLSVQPDPKGIGFSLSTSAYACLNGVIGILLLIGNCRPKNFLYSFVLFANFIFAYHFLRMISAVNSDPSFTFNYYQIIYFAGFALFVMLLAKLIAHLLPQRRIQNSV